MRRRELLIGLPALLGAGLAASRARAIGPRSEIAVGRLQHRGVWNTRPEALHRLLWETAKRTSINAARDGVDVNLAADAGSAASSELFFQPLLVMTGVGELPAFDAKERARLERHLRFGGTLLVDAPSTETAFFAGVDRELTALFPSTTRRALPDDHVLYKSFYLLDGATGRTRDDRQLQSVDVGGRAAVIVSKNDMLGAYERDAYGAWKYECEPGGEAQREMAFRLGVNLLMYATCIDYKSDQVHIPFIMRKTRR